MPNPIRIRNARGELVDAAEVSASDAKNGFGRILDQVASNGGVTITRRRQPIAVVLPVETYRRLAGAEAATLDTLSAEFDVLLARMQAPGMADAMQRAFETPPAALGHAAVRVARGIAASGRAKSVSGHKRPAKSRARRG
jgi:antitoxin Phd